MKSHTIAPTPPMGWNSWNSFGSQINESLICSTADAMVEYGLLDAGYEYLIIDDCWSLKERDSNGNLVADPEKFPHGIRYVADYVHDKGLKLGIYSCCGVRTCAGYPGSLEHEFADAATFASWGVDYLKYDNCNRPESLGTNLLYRRIAMALRNCGRDILLAACQWGTENVHQWIRSSGAQTFRSTVDIQDCWKSIESIASARLELPFAGGAECFNDMDMLVVGMYGKSYNPETAMGGCTDEEYQTHFALWAMLNSPLIIGCDVRNMSEQTQKILTNKELIAINQDPECRTCYKLSVYGNPDAFVLVKPLCDGDYAVGLFNFSDVAANVSVNFWDMGISASSRRMMAMRDCIRHHDAGTHHEMFSQPVPAHGCEVYRCRVSEA